MMQDFIGALKRSWLSHFWINFATCCVLALSFGIIFGSMLFSKNLSNLMNVWGDEIQVTVYLHDSISDSQLQNLLTSIKSNKAVLKSDFIDKSQAAKTFEKSLQNYGPHFLTSLKTDVGNPFPASFQVKLAPEYKNPEQIERIAKSFQQTPGVEDVSYGQEWVSNYSALMKYARMLGIAFAVVIFASCLFTVGNSIQASLNSRREEIEILELIGATAKTIRKPFLVEGAFQGFVASTMSLILLSIVFNYSQNILDKTVGAGSVAQHLSFFSFFSLLLMIALGAGVGALGSYLCVTRINTGWAAAEGKKT